MWRSLPALYGLLLALHAQAADEIQLRIHNDSGESFEHVWQGKPQLGTDVDLGPLAPGQTSRWHRLPGTQAHYRKTRVQLASRHLTGVLPDAPLAPGCYTFVCTLEDGALQVVALRESGCRKPE